MKLVNSTLIDNKIKKSNNYCSEDSFYLAASISSVSALLASIIDKSSKIIFKRILSYLPCFYRQMSFSFSKLFALVLEAVPQELHHLNQKCTFTNPEFFTSWIDHEILLFVVHALYLFLMHFILQSLDN